MKKQLLIFAKEPRMGRVKTRLARDIGKVAAWRFYRHMLYSLPRRLQGKGPWQTMLSVSPDGAKARCFPYQAIQRIAQGQGDLGERMLAPAQSLPAGPFVVIGTDIPDIQPHHIREAFRLLGHNDVVFGKGNDGGFWLVGMKRHSILANPYKNVRWSHAETLDDCLKNLKRYKVAFLEELADVDTAEDLRTVAADKRALSGFLS